MGSIAGIKGFIVDSAFGAVLDLRAANADLEQSMNDLSAAAARQDFAGETDAYSRAADLLREQGKLHDDFFGGFGDQTRQLLSGDLLAGAKAGLGDLIGYGVSDARDDLAAYNREIQALGNPDGLGDALGQPFDTASRSITGATSNVLDFIDATSRLEGVLAEQGALVNYKAAMDDLDASLAENGDTFNVNTEAGRANTQQLLSAGQAAIDYAKNLKGADRNRFLENARQDLRQVADEFPKAGRLIADINRELRRGSGQSYDIEVDSSGLKIAEGQARWLRSVYDEMPEELQTRIETSGIPKSQQEVRILAKAYDLTPREVRTLMTLQAAAAKTGIRDIQGLLTSTGRMRPTPTVNANTGQASGALGALIGQLQTADGYHATFSTTHTITTIRREVRVGVGIGAATGLPRAYGGPVVGPGTERSDNILTPTSPGEWVLQAPAVRKYGEDFISQLNDMAIPTSLPGFPHTHSAKELAAQRAESREQIHNLSRSPDMTATFNSMKQDRYALERQGMMAAQRSSGGGTRTIYIERTGPMRIEGKLKTPFSISDIEGIATQVADSRIQDWRDGDDDFASDMAGRERDL